jgi:hypothetical protein
MTSAPIRSKNQYVIDLLRDLIDRLEAGDIDADLVETTNVAGASVLGRDHFQQPLYAGSSRITLALRNNRWPTSLDREHPQEGGGE